MCEVFKIQTVMNNNTKNLYWAMLICAMAGKNYAVDLQKTSGSSKASYQNSNPTIEYNITPNLARAYQNYSQTYNTNEINRESKTPNSTRTYRNSNPTIGYNIASNSTRTYQNSNPTIGYNITKTFDSSVSQSSDTSNSQACRYTQNGAFLPYDMQNPSYAISQTIILESVNTQNFDQKTKNIFFDICNLVFFPKRACFSKMEGDNSVDASTQKACEAYTLAIDCLSQAFGEGIGSKGCCSSLRAIDAAVFVITYILTDLNRLKQYFFLNKRDAENFKRKAAEYLKKMKAIMSCMARNSSVAPYWDNIDKNLRKAGEILGIDLSLQ
jgi:hypothetical protein